MQKEFIKFIKIWQIAVVALLALPIAMLVVASPAHAAFSDSSPQVIDPPSPQANAQFGSGSTNWGDINGDGYADAVVSEPAYDGTVTNEGRAYIYMGSASGLNAEPSLTLHPPDPVAEEQFGLTMAMGDLNGDGFAEVIIGVPWYDGAAVKTGRVYVYMGSASGLSNTPTLILEPTGQVRAKFGSNISIGDVNGDGFADVVIGAIGYNAGAASEGRAYVYMGSASGLSDVPALTLDPTDQADAAFGGRMVLGDINGDGYADAVISAMSYSAGAAHEGRVYVYMGSASGLSDTPVLTLNPTGQVDVQFGGNISIGDINGDGYADVLIGAAGYSAEAAHEGRVYVYLGSSDGLASSPTQTMDPTDSANAYFGGGDHGMSMGDLNGDGYADAIIAAPFFSGRASYAGCVYVYLGSASGLSSSPSLVLDPNDPAFSFFGMIAAVGDANGDGYADILIGEVNYNGGVGRAYIYYGASDNLQATAGLTLDPTDQANAEFGYGIATGDINGDGYTDAIIGATYFDAEAANEGRAYVYMGSSTGLAASPILTLDPTNEAGAAYELAVNINDFNGDGYGDALLGLANNSGSVNDEGRVYLYLGSASGLTATPAQIMESSDETNARYGVMIASGDYNGDGYADAVIGAHRASGNVSGEGRVYCYQGSAAGLSTEPVLILDPADQDYAYFGLIGSSGDINGDGYDDAIISADGYYAEVDGEGRVYVYLGSASGLSTTPVLILDPVDQEGAHFGSSIAMGDINADGYADAVIDANGYTHDAADEGAAYVYVGSASGLADVPVAILEPTDQASAQFAGMSTVGDINGDGYADAILSSTWFDAEAANEGRVYVYLGSASGLATTAIQTFDPTDHANASFGYGHAIGDLNGDGYGDVLLGAGGYDGGVANEGRAYIYYGGGGKGLARNQLELQPNNDPMASGNISDSQSSVIMRMKAQAPSGRCGAKMQVEIKPVGTPFNGTTNLTTLQDYIDTGASGVTLETFIGSLSSRTAYHWRSRLIFGPICSPGYRYSPWYYFKAKGGNNTDFRTKAAGAPRQIAPPVEEAPVEGGTAEPPATTPPAEEAPPTTQPAEPPATDPNVSGSYSASSAISNTPDINTDLGLNSKFQEPNSNFICVSGSLIKGSLPAVYYCGADGKRYVFVNDKAFFSWYSDFSTVQTISDADVALIPLGGNITYRPGSRMVKIMTDPKVYAVARGGILRWIMTEAAAARLYGADWNKQIDDVPDSFFTNYTLGEPIAE